MSCSGWHLLPCSTLDTWLRIQSSVFCGWSSLFVCWFVFLFIKIGSCFPFSKSLFSSLGVSWCSFLSRSTCPALKISEVVEMLNLPSLPNAPFSCPLHRKMLSAFPDDHVAHREPQLAVSARLLKSVITVHLTNQGKIKIQDSKFSFYWTYNITKSRV